MRYFYLIWFVFELTSVIYFWNDSGFYLFLHSFALGMSFCFLLDELSAAKNKY